jgi:hypothetical protein
MDQVERSVGQGVAEDIVAHDGDVGLTRHRDLDEARIEIRRRHVPRRPHPLAQPAGDRPATSTDLQASPTGSDAGGLQVPNCPGVEQFLEGVEPFLLSSPCIVEGVGHGLT